MPWVSETARFRRWLPPLRPESNDLRNLDLLRLIAATGIVVQHFAGYVPGAPTESMWFLSLFVDLFFAISGFVICFVYFHRLTSWSAYGSFMRRRFARLVPLHWATLAFFSLLGLMLLFGAKVEQPGKYDFACFMPNLLMVHSVGICDQLSFNYASWSISAEMLIYLAFPLFALVARRAPLAPAALGVGAIAVVAAAELIAPHQDMNRFWVSYTSSWGLARAIPSFLIGMSLYSYRGVLAKVPAPTLVMFLGIAAFFALGCLGVPSFYLLPVIYVIVAAAIAADTAAKISALAARISVGGQLTYSIYMLHPVIGVVLLSVLGQKLLHLGTAGEAALASAGVAVVFLVSYLSFACFESPMRRWISTLGSAARRPAVAPLK